jgi:hypothetical protein
MNPGTGVYEDPRVIAQRSLDNMQWKQQPAMDYNRAPMNQPYDKQRAAMGE